MPKGVYKRKPEHSAAMSEIKKNSAASKAAAEAQRGVPKSPETCAVMSVAHTGVKLSPEHCAAISKGTLGVPKTLRTPEMNAAISEGMKNSDAVKDNADKMRGGDDIVRHHFIYDHNNPENHTVEITRSQHMSHHLWMGRNGLEVPHLNVTEKNKDIFMVKYNEKSY